MSDDLSNPSTGKKRSTNNRLIRVLLLILFIGAFGASIYYWVKVKYDEEIAKQEQLEKATKQEVLLGIQKKKKALKTAKIESTIELEKEEQEAQKIKKEEIAQQKRIVIKSELAKQRKLEEISASNFNIVLIKGGLSYNNGLTSMPVSDFGLSKYEVTQLQWRLIMGNNPSYFKNCDQCPVEQVSWNDVQVFIDKLNIKTNRNYRLPTILEWRYAVRGGIKRKGYKYSGSNIIDKVTWCKENARGKTHVVGEKKANELGLFDLNGNVWEWVSDKWPDDYKNTYSDGSKVIYDKLEAQYCGGSWENSTKDEGFGWYTTLNGAKQERSSSIGFRLAHSVVPK